MEEAAIRTLVLTAALALLAAGAASAQQTHWNRQHPPAPPAQGSPPPAAPAPTPSSGSRHELTLYEFPNFQGRQFTYYGATGEVFRQGFQARSARGSGGVWVVCDNGERNCIQVSGQMASLPLDVATVRTSRNELTLYEYPNFQGRQYTWYRPTDTLIEMGFSARSARTTGGPWALCQPRVGCVTVDGSLDRFGIDPGSARPGVAAPGGEQAVGGGVERGQASHPDQGPDRSPYRGGDRADDGWGGSREGSRVREVRFDCRGGWTLTAGFDDRTGTVRVSVGGAPFDVLDRISVDSGFRYEGYMRQFYGEGDKATYVDGGRRLRCRVR